MLLGVSGKHLRALECAITAPRSPDAFAKFTFELESIFLRKWSPYVSDSLALHL